VDIETIAQTISRRMAGSGFDRSVRVDLTGAGTVLIDGESVTVGDGDADCTVTVSADDFSQIVSGDLSPTTAFMTGRMKIDGDMGAAMALAQAL
jgi:putative sterol carrier protein